ncbi:hypothetical protein XAP412_730103 [Xanthomonas phaseoli pv. phaseoli]|uniref:Uncharacterized protein n=1 Tax=Xanthomonas campestris pv. phaseoli TaxID=317013 RepID=A0AB38E3Z5_XANCH|nr:hypothetical protein XAP6984_770101 [Xanthomonas phaseoli pv. phaseoli]SON89575.1 hypothetical protein XAP412_730103 [Xanthomonas phaseoli pv. phaseoli]SON92281.1 hypothetical protein XAP7430_730103 [Xanthomonas phaseoli pv. phaseoli]
MLLGVLAWAGPAQATDQLPDLIQIDGQQATLLAEPLSGPLDDPATWKRFVAHAGSALGSCSANWRCRWMSCSPASQRQCPPPGWMAN